jgi:lactate dehydrogenase-like 2-hydroxyacid dehydrogenase
MTVRSEIARLGSGDVGLSVILAIQISIVFVVAPLAATATVTVQLAEMLRFGLAATMILIVAHNWVVRATVGFAFIATLVASLHWRLGGTADAIVLGNIIVTILFDAVVAAVVAYATFCPGKVTIHRILGAVILYLYVALIFAGMYRLMAVTLHPAFLGLPPGQRGQFSELLYYSLSALTTAGSGDIVAQHPLIRSLSSLEAVIGQLYPATLLARLVTLHPGRTSRMTRPEILMTAPMHPAVVRALEDKFTLHRLWEHADAPAFLAMKGPDIRGLATSSLYGRVSDALLDRLPALEIISSFGVGYDHVDVAAAARRGVVVTHTPGVLDEEVADLTIGLLLATLRQIPQADRFLREGRWRNGAFALSPTLRGRRIGILGLGAIGKAVARRLEGFDVPIAWHGRSPQPDMPYEFHPTLMGLARASDVLIAIVPGGAATKHLIDAEVLAALGPDGVFINVSRGSVVDERALIAALASRQILAAGLDVYEDEPRVPQALIDMPHLVLLPHIGSASAFTREAMSRLVTDNLVSWFASGQPVSPIPESRQLLDSA